ncbi:serine dehydratase beta chain [Shigella flexneri]
MFFKIGIGPSSSRTVGPEINAGKSFINIYGQLRGNFPRLHILWSIFIDRFP